MSENRWSPNAHHRHVFVVFRMDAFQGAEVPLEDSISVTKVFWSQEAAQSEVERLSQLNADKGANYLWTIGRLEDEPTRSEP